MKFIHLSDLHIGKRVNEFSMLEDQKFILMKIINVIDEEKPDGIIIAGDVYDKSIPGDEAYRVLNDFLVKLAKRHVPTYIISGNHDSAVKLSFASELIDMSGIHIAPAYDGTVKSFEQGEVVIHLLPFVKPAIVKNAFPEEADSISDYSDACRVAVSHMNVDTTKVNILVAHQFVTGAERSDSEEVSVGGQDNVNVEVFDAFDYVALGHIHGPQKVGRATVRYCGTPLKYSFSEVHHHKSVTVLEVEGKGALNIREVELVPKRDMRQIEGSYEELTLKANYEGTATDDYIEAILTDEEEIYEGMAKLRMIYPNIMKLTYKNRRSSYNQVIEGASDVEHKSEMELFEEFFELQNNQPLSEEQKEFITALIESIKEVRG